jgi:small subunit ribosomal protein S20
MGRMPQHKSAAKRIKTNARSAARNRPRMSKVRAAIKKVRGATDKQSAADSLRQAYSTVDRTASKRTIHRRKASRIKSRLTKAVNAMSS